MGTKSWVLNRTAKRGSQNWVDFFKKKRISHYVFACFVQLGSKFGVLLSTRQHIYIYMLTPYVPVTKRGSQHQLRQKKHRRDASGGRTLLPFEQKFKQTERNSGGKSLRLNRQIASREDICEELILGIHRSRAAGFGVIMSRKMLNWELIPPK